MSNEYKIKLDRTIIELSDFLEKDFSSKFRTLNEKEDRQLFFLAKILVQLKKISNDLQEHEKIVLFPTLRRK